MVHFNWKLEQRSPEWLEARLGKIGGSDAIGLTTPARQKTMLIQKAAELITGEQEMVYVNDAMQRGIDNEDQVVLDYQLSNGVTVLECGQVTNDEYKYSALSPDGLIENDEEVIVGAVEIKCPSSKNHIGNIVEGKIPTKYMPQIIQYFMIIETLEYLDFISFDDRVSTAPYCEYRVTRKELHTTIEKAIDSYKKYETSMDSLLTKLGAI